MNRLDNFSVPDFHLPFGNAKHPQAARANEEATAWVVRHGLVTDALEQFSGIGCGHLAGRVSGDVPYERVALLAEWMAWSFVLDDQHDHLIRNGQLAAWRPVVGAITAYLDTGRAEESGDERNPLVSGFVDVCGRIVSGMSEACAARYRAHVRLVLRSLDQEAGNRGTDGRPTVEDYVLMRRNSSQLLPMMDMVEAGLGIDLPPRIIELPDFQEAVASTLDVISWGNDVFSLPKEYACGDTNNLVSLISARQGLSLREAVHEVENRIQLRIEDYLAAKQRLFHALDAGRGTDPALRDAISRCLRTYEDWMIGADLWQRYECTRYSDERFAAGLESAYTRPDLVSVA
ncbi:MULTISPECIES: terpene synthase family protein [Streptomyces]|uniref:Terpene synthase n=1 Tax=Streptomyces solicathayae TaxID=3081768 RepID=A0ABZ0M2Y6_9ACTN|nr:terpene synthase family protein [Streptomyces sp. HUAS YS2]WOX26011.1 terpene synthase family protein [Streptomyces sp. HUAS YS2]